MNLNFFPGRYMCLILHWHLTSLCPSPGTGSGVPVPPSPLVMATPVTYIFRAPVPHPLSPVIQSQQAYVPWSTTRSKGRVILPLPQFLVQPLHFLQHPILLP